MKKIVLVLTLMASGSVFANVKGGKFGMDFSFAGSLGLWQTANNGAANMPTFNATPTVGFRYHITDMIAVAPSLGFATVSGTNNATNGDKTENSGTQWGLGLEVPLYLLKLNALDFYVAPGVGYTATSSTSKTTFASGATPTESESTGSYLSFFAAIGLQVPINDQFHVFGKTTIGYAMGTTNPDKKATPTAQPDDKSSYFGVQSFAVGAIFYFN